MQAETVLAVFEHKVYDLRDITVVGTDGKSETIRVTDEHPFYVEGQGWTGADSLTPGEKLEEPDGSAATIMGNVDEPEAAGVDVYNFEVANDHTYFVADGGDGVWVHNDYADARILRQNSIDEGETGQKYAAHIVPTGEFSGRSTIVQKYINYSQGVLDDVGIELNSAENGFFTDSANHVGSHTDKYFEGSLPKPYPRWRGQG